MNASSEHSEHSEPECENAGYTCIGDWKKVNQKFEVSGQHGQGAQATTRGNIFFPITLQYSILNILSNTKY